MGHFGLRGARLSREPMGALKILSGDLLDEERTRVRTLREARAAAALSHPSICTIYEAGELSAGLIVAAGADGGGGELPALPSPGAPYIAMELIEGHHVRGIVFRPRCAVAGGA